MTCSLLRLSVCLQIYAVLTKQSELQYANISHAKINRNQMKNILLKSSVRTNLQYLNIKGNDMEIYPNELFKRTAKKIAEFHYKMENLEIYGHGCRW